MGDVFHATAPTVQTEDFAVSVLEQVVGQVAADESCKAGDQDAHELPPGERAPGGGEAVGWLSVSSGRFQGMKVKCTKPRVKGQRSGEAVL